MISITIFENQWRLFKHNLRGDTDIAADKAMEAFFFLKGGKFRGRSLIHISTRKLTFKTKKDFNHLRTVAEDRTQ